MELVPRPRDGDANVSAKVGEYRWQKVNSH